MQGFTVVKKKPISTHVFIAEQNISKSLSAYELNHECASDARSTDLIFTETIVQCSIFTSVFWTSFLNVTYMFRTN